MVAHYFESNDRDIGRQQRHKCHNVHCGFEFISIVKQNRAVFASAQMKALSQSAESEFTLFFQSVKISRLHNLRLDTSTV